VARKRIKRKIPVRNVLGPALREIRESLDLSQEDVAARLQRAGWSVDRTVVAKIESRRRCITDYELILLGRVLKFSPLEIASTVKTRDLLALAHAEDIR
jgi:transcriptional regulator with XRE-family HTH domain